MKATICSACRTASSCVRRTASSCDFYTTPFVERLGLRAQQRKDRGLASTIRAIYLT